MHKHLTECVIQLSGIRKEQEEEEAVQLAEKLKCISAEKKSRRLY